MASSTTAISITPLALKSLLVKSDIISFADSNVCRVERIYSNPELWTKLCYYIDHFNSNNIVKSLEYNTLITINVGAIPIATDIAISNGKKLLYYDSGKLSIMPPDIDSRALLVIDKIRGENDYDTITQMIKKCMMYDVIIVGILIIFDGDLGEYIRLSTAFNIPIYSVFSICDICDIVYSQNIISQFEYEKYKFNSEKMIKTELQKLD